MARRSPSPIAFCAVLVAVMAALGLQSSPAKAQPGTQWLPGTVVTASGEELHGELRRLNDRMAALGVVFRESPRHEARHLRPDEVERYSFDDGPRYVSRHLEPAADPIFLRKLVDGALTLFSFHFPRDVKPVDPARTGVLFGGEHYLVRDSLGQEATLLNLRYTIRDRTTITRTDVQYRRTLAEQMGDCAELDGRIARLPMSRLHIVELAAEYSECRGIEPWVDETSIRSRTPSVATVAIRGGLGVNVLSGRDSRNDPAAYQAGAVVFELRRADRPWRVGLVAELGIQRKPAGQGDVHFPHPPEHFSRGTLAAAVGLRIPFADGGRIYTAAGLTGGRLLHSDEFVRAASDDSGQSGFSWAYRTEWGSFLEVGHRPAGTPGPTLALRVERTALSYFVVPGHPLGWRNGNVHRHTTLGLLVGYAF